VQKTLQWKILLNEGSNIPLSKPPEVKELSVESTDVGVQFKNINFRIRLIKPYFPTAQTSSPTNAVLLMLYAM
jgi:hypothetical protein